MSGAITQYFVRRAGPAPLPIAPVPHTLEEPLRAPNASTEGEEDAPAFPSPSTDGEPMPPSHGDNEEGAAVEEEGRNGDAADRAHVKKKQKRVAHLLFPRPPPHPFMADRMRTTGRVKYMSRLQILQSYLQRFVRFPLQLSAYVGRASGDVQTRVTKVKFDQYGSLLAVVRNSGITQFYDFDRYIIWALNFAEARESSQQDICSQIDACSQSALHPVLELKSTLRGEDLAWNPNNSNIVLCSFSTSKDLHIYDLAVCQSDKPTLSLLGEGGRGIFAVSFIDGNVLAGGCRDGKLRIWDTRTSKRPKLELHYSKSGSINSLEVHPSGGLLAAGRTIDHWDYRKPSLPVLTLDVQNVALEAGVYQPQCSIDWISLNPEDLGELFYQQTNLNCGRITLSHGNKLTGHLTAPTSSSWSSSSLGRLRSSISSSGGVLGRCGDPGGLSLFHFDRSMQTIRRRVHDLREADSWVFPKYSNLPAFNPATNSETEVLPLIDESLARSRACPWNWFIPCNTSSVCCDFHPTLNSCVVGLSDGQVCVVGTR